MSITGGKKTGGILGIWKAVIDFTLSEPRILLPFVILAALETILLWVLSCSPHFPFNYVLAPPVSRIWGPQFLHYPYIYDLLPRLFYYANMVVSVLVGSLISGMAVNMIFLSDKHKKVDLKETFFFVSKRYVSLVMLAAVLYITVHFIMKQPPIFLLKYFRGGHAKLLFLGPQFWFNVFYPVLSFLLAVFLQGLFVYSFPFVVIKGKKFLIALFLGMRLFFRSWLKTLIVVTIPMLLYIPVTMLRDNIGMLADKFAPEVVMVVLFVGIVVGTIIVDALVTIVTTLLFIEATDHEA